MFAIGLYTGLRFNEYKTAYIEDGFIVANNSYTDLSDEFLYAEGQKFKY